MSWLAAVNTRAPFVATGALLPLVIAGLHLSQVTAGLLTGLPLLVLAALSVPGGRLGDRYGPYPLLLATALVIAIGGALRSASTTATLFLLGVGVLGAGVGLAQPALVQAAKLLAAGRETLATTVYSNGLVLGGLMGSALSAPVLLPLAGGSWRGVFLLWAGLGMLAALGWALAMRRSTFRVAPRPPAAADAQGPVRIPGFVPLILLFCAETAIFYALVTWLPDYDVARGATVAAAALPLSALSLGSVGGGLLSPLLVRWCHGFRGALFWTGFADVLAQLGFLILPGGGVAWAAVAGATTAVALTLGMAAPAALSPDQRTGRASGILLAWGYGIGAVGPLGVGSLRQVLGSFVPGFALLAALSALWTAAALFIPRGTAQGV